MEQNSKSTHWLYIWPMWLSQWLSGKEPSCNAGATGDASWSLGPGDPLEEDRATDCRILAWRIPWTEEFGRLQSIGSQRVKHDWSDLAHTMRSKMAKAGDARGRRLRPRTVSFPSYAIGQSKLGSTHIQKDRKTYPISWKEKVMTV